MDGIEVVGNVGEDHKPGVSFCGLICFIYGQHAIRLKGMEQSARRDAVCHSLAKFYDTQEALKVKGQFWYTKSHHLLLFSLLSSNNRMTWSMKLCVISYLFIFKLFISNQN
jgi:hypothetical protein